MCPKLTFAATALVLLLAGPALAQTAAPAKATPATTTGSAGANTPPAKPASPEARAAADRLGPLERAAFWGAEVSKNSKDTEAGVKLALALRQLGRIQEAYEAASNVLALQPDNVDALLETARTVITDGQGFFAIAPMKKLQALRPKDWRAPDLLGVAYEQTNQPQMALQAYNEANALSPNNPAILCNLGMFFAAQGDRQQAETLLRRAAALPDASAQVRQDLAFVLGLDGRLGEAEALQRQDLPPEMAENNLAYLRAATSPLPVGAPSPAAQASAAPAEPKDRNWDAVAKAQAQLQ